MMLEMFFLQAGKGDALHAGPVSIRTPRFMPQMPC